MRKNKIAVLLGIIMMLNINGLQVIGETSVVAKASTVTSVDTGDSMNICITAFNKSLKLTKISNTVYNLKVKRAIYNGKDCLIYTDALISTLTIDGVKPIEVIKDDSSTTDTTVYKITTADKLLDRRPTIFIKGIYINNEPDIKTSEVTFQLLADWLDIVDDFKMTSDFLAGVSDAIGFDMMVYDLGNNTYKIRIDSNKAYLKDSLVYDRQLLNSLEINVETPLSITKIQSDNAKYNVYIVSMKDQIDIYNSTISIDKVYMKSKPSRTGTITFSIAPAKIDKSIVENTELAEYTNDLYTTSNLELVSDKTFKLNTKIDVGSSNNKLVYENSLLASTLINGSKPISIKKIDSEDPLYNSYLITVSDVLRGESIKFEQDGLYIGIRPSDKVDYVYNKEVEGLANSIVVERPTIPTKGVPFYTGRDVEKKLWTIGFFYKGWGCSDLNVYGEKGATQFTEAFFGRRDSTGDIDMGISILASNKSLDEKYKQIFNWILPTKGNALDTILQNPKVKSQKLTLDNRKVTIVVNGSKSIDIDFGPIIK